MSSSRRFRQASFGSICSDPTSSVERIVEETRIGQQIGCQTDSATEDFAAGRRRLQRRTRAALTATGDQAKVDDVVELIQDLTRESVSRPVYTLLRSVRAYAGVRDSQSLQPAADPAPATPSQHHTDR